MEIVRAAERAMRREGLEPKILKNLLTDSLIIKEPTGYPVGSSNIFFRADKDSVFSAFSADFLNSNFPLSPQGNPVACTYFRIRFLFCIPVFLYQSPANGVRCLGPRYPKSFRGYAIQPKGGDGKNKGLGDWRRDPIGGNLFPLDGSPANSVNFPKQVFCHSCFTQQHRLRKGGNNISDSVPVNSVSGQRPQNFPMGRRCVPGADFQSSDRRWRRVFSGMKAGHAPFRFRIASVKCQQHLLRQFYLPKQVLL